ncbi:hypothetical protein EYF80_009440 [Liparis tanakae]|uniref:Uncharacterized protein n=1 Tax=Liparis tanakae TaxID=230148 RepID=A0A4Z2IRD6_9TELE|nr:hypothetical protein EYF80_009440 [Liparis tanakae]
MSRFPVICIQHVCLQHEGNVICGPQSVNQSQRNRLNHDVSSETMVFYRHEPVPQAAAQQLHRPRLPVILSLGSSHDPQRVGKIADSHKEFSTKNHTKAPV